MVKERERQLERETDCEREREKRRLVCMSSLSPLKHFVTLFTPSELLLSLGSWHSKYSTAERQTAAVRQLGLCRKTGHGHGQRHWRQL